MTDAPERAVVPVTLTGTHVALAPLAQVHAADLAAQVGDLHRLWYTPIPSPEGMPAEIDRRLNLADMVPFDKYAAAAQNLGKPSSAARAVFAGDGSDALPSWSEWRIQLRDEWLSRLCALLERGIAAGELGQSVQVPRDDEVGALADAFNTMSTRLAESTALRQRMTSDVSHDLRTPVTAVLGTLELIESGALGERDDVLRALLADESAPRLERREGN